MINLNQRRWLTIKAHLIEVILAPQFDACDIAQQHLGAIGVGPHHNLAELLGRFKSSAGIYRVGKFGAGGCRFPTDLSRRHQNILLLNSSGNVRHRKVQLGQLIRPDPDTHSVLGYATTEDLGKTDAPDPRQFVDHVNRGIIGEKAFIVGIIRGDQGDKQQWK